jgi:hypothetical protein
MGWGNVAEAARECGLERESWRLWELTGREPRQLVTICMAIRTRTGVDLDWLLRGPSRADLHARAEHTHRDVDDLQGLFQATWPERATQRVLTRPTFGDARRGIRTARPVTPDRPASKPARVARGTRLKTGSTHELT